MMGRFEGLEMTRWEVPFVYCLSNLYHGLVIGQIEGVGYPEGD